MLLRLRPSGDIDGVFLALSEISLLTLGSIIFKGAFPRTKYKKQTDERA